MAKDPRYREGGGKGYIKNPDGSINETNYTNANSDLNAASAVLEAFYPDWREKWLSNGKLKRGSIPKLKGIIDKVENIDELRKKEDYDAIRIEKALEKVEVDRKFSSDDPKYTTADPPHALEGLKIMSREWQKLSNMDKYGQKTAYERNIELDQIEKNAPKRPRPPPPPPRPDGKGGNALAIASASASASASVNNVINITGGQNPPPPPEEPDDEKLVRLIVRSQPPKGIHFVVDGASHYVTDHGVPVYINTQHEVIIDSTYTARNGKVYVFSHWDDGVPTNARTVYVGRDDETITAIYEEEAPPPPPPEDEQIFTGEHRVIVDSQPMREVHITVEIQGRDVTDAELLNNLPPMPPARIGPVLARIRAAIAELRNANIEGANEGETRQLQTEFLARRLASVGIRDSTGVADFIVRRSNWVMLDRVAAPPNTFVLRRPTGATTDAAAGYVGPLGGTPPGPVATPRHYVATYHRNRIDVNSYTIFEVILPHRIERVRNEQGQIEQRGVAVAYRFTAPQEVQIRDATKSGNQTTEVQGGQQARFVRWDIYRGDRNEPREDIRAGNAQQREREIRSRRTGVTVSWNRQYDLNLGPGEEPPIRMVAIYSATASHERRPELRGGYGRGVSEGRFGRGQFSRDTAFQAFGAKAFQRGGIDRNRETQHAKVGAGVQSEYRNNAVRAAVNKGKRILNQYARAEYTRLFESLQHEYDDRRTRLRELRQNARTARGNLRRVLRNQPRWFERMRLMGSRNDQDLVNRADNAIAADPALAGSATEQWRNDLAAFQKAYDEYFREFKQGLESASAQMESHMIGRAETVSVQLARRFRMPINSEDEQQVAAMLREYAVEISERFISRGRTMMFAFTRGLENLSRGLQTASESGYSLLGNTVNFIFGPWTWTTAFVLLQFFFVLTYVGYNITYLWIFPIIGAAFTFILNFSESFKPLDWVTHLSSGAIIGYSAMLLLVSLGALNWSFMSTFTFWIIWAILGFLGLFQFYQNGGWKVAMQGGVIVLLFSYVALGPYSAYYQQALDQVKTPVE